MTQWTIATQAPLSMEFSSQEYWSGLLFPSLGDLPHPGIKLRSPTLQGDALPSEPPGQPIDIHISILFFKILFPYRSLQNIEQNSLCYTVGPCWFSI